MKIFKLTPMIYTAFIKETVEFYAQILGFKVLSYQPELGWAYIQFENAEIMISQPNELLPFEKANFTGTFYFTTDNATEIWEKVKDKALVCYPIKDFEYGMREFAIYDYNGYLLQFGQPLK